MFKLRDSFVLKLPGHEIEKKRGCEGQMGDGFVSLHSFELFAIEVVVHLNFVAAGH